MDEDDVDEGDRFSRARLQNLQPVGGSTQKSYSSIPSNGCSFLCLTCWLRGTVLHSCWVLAIYSHCILFSLEQSRVVDLTVAEHHPDLILEPNVLSFEFSQLSSRRVNNV